MHAGKVLYTSCTGKHGAWYRTNFLSLKALLTFQTLMLVCWYLLAYLVNIWCMWILRVVCTWLCIFKSSVIYACVSVIPSWPLARSLQEVQLKMHNVTASTAWQLRDNSWQVFFLGNNCSWTFLTWLQTLITRLYHWVEFKVTEHIWLP